MRKVLNLLTVVAVGTAGPLLAQDVDPVGKYEFTTTVEGQAVGGTFEITGTPGNWAGLIIAEGPGEIPVSRVEVSGNVITLIANIPEQGELLVELHVDGDEITGSWSLGFDGGEIQGRRVQT